MMIYLIEGEKNLNFIQINLLICLRKVMTEKTEKCFAFLSYLVIFLSKSTEICV